MRESDPCPECEDGFMQFCTPNPKPGDKLVCASLACNFEAIFDDFEDHSPVLKLGPGHYEKVSEGLTKHSNSATKSQCCYCQKWFPTTELDGPGRRGNGPLNNVWCIFCDDPTGEHPHAARGTWTPDDEPSSPVFAQDTVYIVTYTDAAVEKDQSYEGRTHAVYATREAAEAASALHNASPGQLPTKVLAWKVQGKVPHLTVNLDDGCWD